MHLFNINWQSKCDLKTQISDLRTPEYNVVVGEQFCFKLKMQFQSSMFSCFGLPGDQGIEGGEHPDRADQPQHRHSADV